MKKPLLNIVSLNGCSILEQLRLEEALLRADERNWCVINTGAPKAIVMGISGIPDLLINQKLLNEKPVPVIRRFSGGGTVFIDEQTCFVTMICNQTSVPIACFPEHVLRWNGRLYEDVLKDHAFRVVENDYVLGEKKCGGNAQYFCKKRWLHHTSLLWDYEDKNMEYLLMPAKTPKYREKRKHHEFLCKLCHYMPSKDGIFTGIIERLKQDFELIESQEKEWEVIKRIPHRQATVLL